MKKLIKKLEIEFENEEDYRQFLDGMTLTDRNYCEVEQ